MKFRERMIKEMAGESQTLTEQEKALIQFCYDDGFGIGAGENLVSLIRRAGLSLQFNGCLAEE